MPFARDDPRRIREIVAHGARDQHTSRDRDMTRHAAWRNGTSAVSTSTLHAITLQDIERAAGRLAGLALRTPLRRSWTLCERLHAHVLLKMETAQPTGAFKLRGAANRLLALSERERKCGVITVSTGNHGRAVAYAARELGVRCVVCLSELVPSNKVASVAAFGAETDVAGANQDAAFERAQARAKREELVFVDPFDDPWVIAGQGTIGVELAQDLGAPGTVIVPISGGGLASGVAVACKALSPPTRVVGVASERCPAMLRSLEAGRPVEVPEHPSLADSLGGGIGLDNRYTFGIVRDLVDEIHVVSESEIADALRFAFFNERVVVEGAAAAALAVLLRSRVGEFPSPIVVVLTGDNIDMHVSLDLLNRAPAASRVDAVDV
jgi:threonine dehydratase